MLLTIETAINDSGDPVAEELECRSSGAALGGGEWPFLITLEDLRAKRNHVKLTIHHHTDDMSTFSIHDGIAVDELGVIELRTEVQTCGSVVQT